MNDLEFESLEVSTITKLHKSSESTFSDECDYRYEDSEKSLDYMSDPNFDPEIELSELLSVIKEIENILKSLSNRCVVLQQYVTESSPSLVIDIDQYSDRMNDLRELAPDEGLTFDEASMSYFFKFLENAPFPVRKAAIGLGVNGEINGVWVSEDGEERLSIEFYSDGEVKYAWLPSDGSVEIRRVSSNEFWSYFQEKLHDFLT